MIIIFCLPGAGQVLNDRSAVTVTRLRPHPATIAPMTNTEAAYMLAGCHVSLTDVWTLVLGSQRFRIDSPVINWFVLLLPFYGKQTFSQVKPLFHVRIILF